jgi:lipopolysaccharide biosynthesis glycosyltransferase
MLNKRKNTAVTFVTDDGFLIPSIVAALQIIDQPAVTEVADIFILMVGIDSKKSSEVERLLANKQINFASLAASSFMPGPDVFFNTTHVPKTALGRFAIHKALPAQYENIIYLDGDVQIVGDIAPLVRIRMPPGHIAAAPDFLWLTEDDIGKFWRTHKEYLLSLGIQDPKKYFNSGVLAADRATWAQKSEEALQYFARNSQLCFYHDQSALNAVFAGSVRYLSPVYNYGSMYASLGLHDELQPKIIHFTGGGKPWRYFGPPWNGNFYYVYEQFLKHYPTLSSYIEMPNQRQRTSTLGELNFREMLLTALRLPRRRKAMRRFMKNEKFALN